MGCSSGEVGETKAAEHAKMIICGVKAMKAVIWCLVVNGTRGTSIEKVGSGVEGFDPKGRGEFGLD